MLPIGHMGITVAIVRVIERYFKSPWIDYRLLLVASLLPDLIDKPIAYLFGSHPKIGGSTLGHSLLFLLLFFIIALVQWYYRRNSGALILWSGASIHDVLDFISHHEDWMDKAVFNTNTLIVFEGIGGCILIYFFIRLVLNNKVKQFRKTGQLASACHKKQHNVELHEIVTDSLVIIAAYTDETAKHVRKT